MKYTTEQSNRYGRIIRISNPAYERLKIIQGATGASMADLVDKVLPYLDGQLLPGWVDMVEKLNKEQPDV